MPASNPEIARKSQHALRGKWGLAIGTFLVYMVISGGAGVIPLAPLLIGGPFAFGTALFSLSVSRGKEAKLEQIFSGFGYFTNTLVTYLLMCLYIVLWSLLLIVPGIIAALGYSMTFYLLVDDPTLQPKAALQKSKDMMYGYKWKLFYLCLRFFGLAILCIFTLGIGFLWLVPYINVTMAGFYDDLKGNNTGIAETIDRV